jgi:MYXO-CTERM domain-containing protein
LFFTPYFLSGSVIEPSLSSGLSVNSVTFAPNFDSAGWSVSGDAGTPLTLTQATAANSNNGLFALSVRGPTVATFNGPAIQGATAAVITVGFDSTLVLKGSSVAVTNIDPGADASGKTGGIFLSGGTLLVDDSGVSPNANRIANSAAITLTGGGTFAYVGNSAGSSETLGAITLTETTGLNQIRITPGTAIGGGTVPATLTFGNTGTFTLAGLNAGRTAFRFTATAGNLGDAAGARVLFGATPTQANGLIGAGAVTVTDDGGTDFAVYDPTAGVIRAGASLTVDSNTSNTDAITALNQGTSSSRVQFTPAANTTYTANASINAASFRVGTSGAGAILDMGSNTLNTAVLMLDGPDTFTINGSGSISSTGTRFIYVNNPAATLKTSLNLFATGGLLSGPGFVEMTSGTAQNTLGSAGSRITLIGGVTLRANSTEAGGFGFNASGAGTYDLGGGVIEIKDGHDGDGSAADLTRGLGNGGVIWRLGTTSQEGSGGFSAYDNNASVAIGSSASATLALTWNNGNFVQDGYALLFGSTQSNARLRFINPINLGATIVTGGYAAREIRVIDNPSSAADYTRLDGVVSGTNAGVDLLKTGGGRLELAATNTYVGGTIVQGGTLQVTGTISTGAVSVYSGTTLEGTGSVAGLVSVKSGGTVRGGAAGSIAGPLNLVGGATLNGDATNGAALAVDFNGQTTPNGAPATSIVSVSGGGLFQLSTSAGPVRINLINDGAGVVQPGTPFTATLVTADHPVNPAVATSFILNGIAVTTNGTQPHVIDPSVYSLSSTSFSGFSDVFLAVNAAGDALILTATAVPEPDIALGLVVFAGAGLLRRRRR